MANSMNLHQETENIRLSLSDLVQQSESNYGDSPDDQRNPDSHSIHHQYSFEFSTIPSSSCSSGTRYTTPDRILFCGKIITRRTADIPVEYPDTENVDSSAGFSNENKVSSDIPSFTKPCLPSPGIGKSSVGGGGGNLSGNSRKHKVLIGLEKMPTEMELSDIRERQSRRKSPHPMFPAVAGDETSSDGAGSRKGHSSILLSKRKAQLRSRLSKAYFGCFQAARTCN